MNNNDKTTISIPTSPFYALFGIFTGFLGYHINKVVLGSDWPVFWGIMDALFPLFCWIKWLICGQVNVSIIKAAFAFFIQ